MKKVILLFVCLNSALYGLPSFEKAMEINTAFKSGRLTERARWTLAKRLYEDFDHLTATVEPRIPKIIHQIWVGSPFPEKYKKFQETWQKKHPDWTYILWTDADIRAFGLTNQYAYDQATNYGEKADIARYEILYRLGGLYIDTDFECICSFDELHHKLNFYAGFGFTSDAEIFNGLIGSVPSHPILKACIDNLQPKPKGSHDTLMSIINRSGPRHLTRNFFKYVDDSMDRVVIFPCTVFYPWPNYARDEKDPYKYIRPETLAIHHWHISWAGSLR